MTDFRKTVETGVDPRLKIISDYQIEARSAFIVYKKDKSFGSRGKLKFEVLAPLSVVLNL